MARIRVRTVRHYPTAPPPHQVLRGLPAGSAPVLLDSATGGWSVLGWAPDREISGELRPRDEASAESGARSARPWPLADRDPAAELEAACAGESWLADETELPLGCGWMGWFGFECGHAYERFPWLPRHPGGLPDFHFARFPAALLWAPDGSVRLLVAEHADADARLAAVDGLLGAATDPEAATDLGADAEPAALAADLPAPRPAEPDGERFQEGVRQLRGWIAEGELYQANLSHRMEAAWSGDPRALYGHLRGRQPTTMSAYWEDAAGRALISQSPERFLRVDGPRLESRPIKGTAPRGADAQEDAAQAAALEASAKERAELTMIVDMVRNDLGRLAPPGTVEVRSTGEVETFPTLFHRTATVRSRWDPGRGLAALLRATFPPASVTGAPKVRALQAIAELEGVARGPYCGALGYWIPGPRPRGDFSVLIRTAVHAAGQLSLAVGAGIVWDSDPLREWQETVLKGQYLVRP